MITDFAGLNVTVMGLGRFGGGVGVTRFLADRGAEVLVTDTLASEELQKSVGQLADLEKRGEVHFRLGEHNVSDFTTSDLVVVNPAVKPDNRFVRAARAADIPITSEIRLLVQHLPNRRRTIGVTGSAGKSTTTAMIGHVLRRAVEQESRKAGKQSPNRQITKSPNVWVGGNLGGSLLPRVDEIQPDDWVVLELSSFMLEGLREDKWSPHIAVVTNISPNHLDWHGSMANYVAAKQVILLYQQENDQAFVDESAFRAFSPTGAEFDEFREWGGSSRNRGRYVFTWDDGEPDVQLAVPGKHNVRNAVLAAAVAKQTLLPHPRMRFVMGPEAEAYDRALDRIEVALREFPGLPHRLAFVGEFGGVKCYNDSKSTTPEAARLAIESFDPGTVRVILGGYDKGADFAELAEVAARRCAGVYTIGATGEGMASLVEEAGRGTGAEAPYAVRRCGTLDVAVERALGEATASGGDAGGNSGGDSGGGGVLVLSPGCASWDQFANYEARGERFVELVRAWEASP
jgi:UDP-N-acetylmuramoylalanine--D-glutamate ligase